MSSDVRKTSPERRYLTIMFIDLVGSTELSEQLDPEDLAVIIGRYQQLAVAVMDRFGGFVAQFSGDGILVYFGYPYAHGNDTERALRAALEMIAQLRKLDIPLLSGITKTLSARVGVHTGLVIVGGMSSDANIHGIVGEAANMSARLQNEAPTNGVVISLEAHRLVERLFEFAPLGARMLKGFSRPIEAFQVIRARPIAGRDSIRQTRSASGMIGRGPALARLVALLQAVRQEGRRQIVVVRGDAGIGKTRLVSEFFSHPAVGTLSIAQAQCQELFSNTALAAFTSFLWRQANLRPEDSEDARRAKLEIMLDGFGLRTSENKHLIERIPGLGLTNAPERAESANLLKISQFELIKGMVSATVAKTPLIICVEDAHWLDPSSAELLRELALIEEAPVLMLFTARSFPRGPPLPGPSETIVLEPLLHDDGLQLAVGLPGAHTLSDELIARAIQAADGVPLFIEQLILSLVEEQRQPESSRPWKAGRIPLALAEQMSERLDRRPGARRIVQAAACLGRSFTPEFLAAILDDPADALKPQLDLLVDAEILRPMRVGVDLRYEFRHSLLQRMARDSMVEPERRAAHQRVAELLQTAPDIPLPPEVAAFHLSEAGQFTQAVQKFLRAGIEAAQQSTHVEAIDHLQKGIALLEKIPLDLRRELEIRLRVALMSSLAVTQFATSQELSDCCARGIELCREHGETPMAFPFVFGQFTVANCRGQIAEARSLADLFLSLSEKSRYGSGLVIGHRLRGMCLLGQGDLSAARSDLERSLELYSHERDATSVGWFGQNPRVHAQSLLALTAFCQGEVRLALLLGREALQAADSMKDPHSAALALSYVGGMIFGYCSAPGRVANQAAQLLALCSQHRLSGYRPHALAFLGWAECQSGEAVAGAAKIEAAIKAFDSVEYRLGVASHLCNLADARRRMGQFAEAKIASARAIDMMAVGAGMWLEPEIRRVRRPDRSRSRRGRRLRRDRGARIGHFACPRNRVAGL